jgi:gliding motility-associated-like protein
MSGQSNTTLLLSDLQLGTYTFRLTATDNEDAIAFSETTVQVVAPVLETVIFAGRDTTLVLPNNLIALVGEVSSAQLLIVSYTWAQVAGTAASIVGEYPEVSAVDLMPGSYTFRFSVTDIAGNITIDDVVVSVIEDKSNPLGAALFFSPNDDLYNDTWEVKNMQLIEQCPIKIFNVLGKKVFEAEYYENDWGGTMNGTLLKEGDYYYVIDCGDKKIYSGALRLIR